MRFVLIHGGFHGAWCWTHTIPELEKLGHQAVAIDLPGHGKRVDDTSTLATRCQAILDVLQQGDVLVGHSGGGYDISLAADAAPGKIKHLIYLAAAAPIEGRPLVEASGGTTDQQDSGSEEVTRLMDDDTGMSAFVRPTSNGKMECFDFDAVWKFFYHDCDENCARRAFNLLTPAPTEFLLETVHLPRFWQADLPRSYIQCREDRSLRAETARHYAKRLGVNPLIIEGSHSPFLSRPRGLAEMLVKATTTTPIGPLLPA